MFKKRLFNRVEGDAGFVVKIRAFKGFVEYREGPKFFKPSSAFRRGTDDCPFTRQSAEPKGGIHVSTIFLVVSDLTSPHSASR